MDLKETAVGLSIAITRFILKGNPLDILTLGLGVLWPTRLKNYWPTIHSL